MPYQREVKGHIPPWLSPLAPIPPGQMDAARGVERQCYNPGKSAQQTAAEDGMDLFDFESWQVDAAMEHASKDSNTTISVSEYGGQRPSYDEDGVYRKDVFPREFTAWSQSGQDVPYRNVPTDLTRRHPDKLPPDDSFEDEAYRQALIDRQLHGSFTSGNGDLQHQNQRFWEHASHNAESAHISPDQGPESLNQIGQSEERESSEDSASEQSEDDDFNMQHMVSAARQSLLTSNPLQCISTPLEIWGDDTQYGIGVIDVMEYAVNEGQRKGVFQDRWEVDRECAGLLASVMSFVKVDSSAPWDYGIRTETKDLKLEEPVLLTDPDADMRVVYERHEVHVSSKNIEPFRLDIDKDESVVWSANARAAPSTVGKQIAAEKLQIKKDSMDYMRELYAMLGGDVTDYTEAERRRKAVPRASPTILPRSPPLSPAMLSSDVANIELTSTPEDPALIEVASIDARIAVSESAQLQPVDIDVFLDFEGTPALSSPHGPDKNMLSLRASTPVLPCPDQKAEKQQRKPPQTIASMDDHALIPSPDTDVTDPHAGAEEAATELKRMFEPLTSTAIMKLNHELLCEADTTMRVTVPEVPTLEPVLPWQKSKSAKSLLIKELECLSNDDRKWSGITKLEKALSWRPFPSHFAKLKPEGNFDDGSCVRYLAELALNDELDIHRLTWKPEGCRLFDEDENEDDGLGAVEFQDGGQSDQVHDEENIIQISGTKTPADERARQQTSTAEVQSALNRSSASLHITAKCPAQQQPAPSGPNSGLADAMLKRKLQIEQEMAAKRKKTSEKVVDANSPSGGLARLAGANAMEHFGQFLGLQGQVAVPTSKPAVSERPGYRALPAGSVNVTVGGPDLEVPIADLTKPRVPIPGPNIDSGDKAIPIIVSSAIMADRHMIRKLQELLPALEIISRDQLGHDREADIILAPGTGLLLTSLQKLKQKPLPGTKGFVGIREQIRVSALYHEQLEILVSEGGLSGDVRSLGERDTEAITDFIAEMSHLSSEVQVTYIPGGSHDLIRWIAGAICRHALSDGGARLLQEETFWERFLRKAGLNAYAAQVVLGQLKCSVTANGYVKEATGLSGLPVFVQMSEEDRVQRFGPLVGGETMIRRASKLIDARWVSAANTR